MLEVHGLSVAYGQHVALEDASLKVDRGEIVVILGANGAGKSSLLKAISGVCEGKVSGSVRQQGHELTGLSPHAIVEAGIALVPEGRGVFPDLTVQDNLKLGAHNERARDDEEANLSRVLSLFPKLGERKRQIVRTMSGGEQQMVAIGRAMMSSPAILTLDEPSLGLSPLLCKDLFASLKTVRDAGIGILLVEQNAKQSLAIADRGYLIENGRIVHEAPAEKLMTDPAVQKAYLGGAAASGHAAATSATAARAPTATAPQPRAERSTVPPSGPSPSDIAAAAMQKFATPSSATPQKAAMPPQAPTPKPISTAPARAPQTAQATPSPTRANGASSPPPTKPDTIDIGDLVARARNISASHHNVRLAAPNDAQRSVTGAASAQSRNSTTQTASPYPTRTASGSTDLRLPDLGDSTNRLQAVLDEIEAAAAKAQAYRPGRRN